MQLFHDWQKQQDEEARKRHNAVMYELGSVVRRTIICNRQDPRKPIEIPYCWLEFRADIEKLGWAVEDKLDEDYVRHCFIHVP